MQISCYRDGDNSQGLKIEIKKTFDFMKKKVYNTGSVNIKKRFKGAFNEENTFCKIVNYSCVFYFC